MTQVLVCAHDINVMNKNTNALQNTAPPSAASGSCILRTVNTQHRSRQDAIITIRFYLATCFGHKRPSSGQLRKILRYSKNSTQRDPISFTLKQVLTVP